MLSSEVMVIAEKINKALGQNTVVLGSDVVSTQRITSGSLSFDVALGGGWPLNQWVELVGEPSHGKTAVALRTIAANQEKNPDFTVVWIAAEPWSADFAALCGVDASRVLVVETNIMEDAFESVLAFSDSKSVDMIVIDSLPALVPTLEDEKSMEESTVGKAALLVGKFFRKALKSTKRSLDGSERGVLGLVINQYRMKIGVMYGDPRTTPGGVGKDYAYAVRAEIKRDEWLKLGSESEKNHIGQTIRMHLIKNKTAPPKVSAYVDFYFKNGGPVDAGSYDYAKEIATMAIYHGVVDRKGSWFSYGDAKWQGASSLIDSIREEIDLKEDLEKQVLSIIRRGRDDEN